MDSLTSRFFTTRDTRMDAFVLPLLPSWWSRFYEYPWAGAFTCPEHTVLDAACGIEHPFKFYLLDHARLVYACDREEGITSGETIRKGLRETYGKTVADGLPERYLREIRFRRASITELPYGDGMFDRIFCISVLEHLTDYFNRYPWLPGRVPLTYLLKKDIFLTLREFKRALKSDGLIVLTFDYPNINLEYLAWAMSSIGLDFAGDVSFEIPEGALYSATLDLYCFRAILKKKGLEDKNHDATGF